MEENTELYSIKEGMAYSKENAKLIMLKNGVYIYATPSGEPLVTRRR